MFRFLTIRKTIALMLITLFLLTGSGLTAFLVYDKFETRKLELIENTKWLAESGSQQRVAIYYRDKAVLNELLGQFLQNSAIQYATVFDQQGIEISNRYQESVISSPIPDFVDFRADSGQLEVAQVENANPAGPSTLLNLSVPIFSFTSPLEKDVSRETFGQTLALARNQGAQHVMGYYLFGLDLEQLRGNAMEYGLKVAVDLLRRVVLERIGTAAGYDTDFIDDAFDVFDEVRNDVDIFPGVIPALEMLSEHFVLIAVTNGNANLEK